jgi:hypothetical protein
MIVIGMLSFEIQALWSFAGSFAGNKYKVKTNCLSYVRAYLRPLQTFSLLMSSVCRVASYLSNAVGLTYI